jgi:hypothetical protein
MNTTTQLAMTNVNVQKIHRLDNQQPSYLMGRRFNDHSYGKYAQVSGSAEGSRCEPRYGLDCAEMHSRFDSLGIKWYYGFKQTRKEKAMLITIEVVERFHEKWEVNEKTGCWDWKASVAGKGYGQMKIPGMRKQVYAHRLSYVIHYPVATGVRWWNNEIPRGLCVCHVCDNPLCVKPSHLFLGTAKDNLQDMKAKDRHLKGERNAKAKLTENKVIHIHRLSDSGVSQGKIAQAYGVSQGQVFKILHGIRWNDVYKKVKPFLTGSHPII